MAEAPSSSQAKRLCPEYRNAGEARLSTRGAIRPRRLRDVDEIGEVLSEAVLKSRKIVIQIEERDSNGYYRPDIVGMIQGSDELGIYVGGTKVGYDEIRNVAFSNELKWSDMERIKV